MTRGTTEYMAPELAKSILQNKELRAKPSLDIFSLGRIMQWLTTLRRDGKEEDADIFWPNLGEDATTNQKLVYLASDEPIELAMNDIPHGPSRNIVAQMLVKNDENRLTIEKLLSGSYLAMDLDTYTIQRNSISTPSKEVIL